MPGLEPIELPLGKVLYESDDPGLHAYFPTDSIVSLLYMTSNGASAEIAMVGTDGIVGVAVFMGGESMTTRAVVQSAGSAFRMPRQKIERRVRSDTARCWA